MVRAARNAADSIRDHGIAVDEVPARHHGVPLERHVVRTESRVQQRDPNSFPGVSQAMGPDHTQLLQGPERSAVVRFVQKRCGGNPAFRDRGGSIRPERHEGRRFLGRRGRRALRPEGKRSTDRADRADLRHRRDPPHRGRVYPGAHRPQPSADVADPRTGSLQSGEQLGRKRPVSLQRTDPQPRPVGQNGRRGHRRRLRAGRRRVQIDPHDRRIRRARSLSGNGRGDPEDERQSERRAADCPQPGLSPPSRPRRALHPSSLRRSSLRPAPPWSRRRSNPRRPWCGDCA